MKVYLDLIIVINFFYDFLIISSTSTLLKRNVPVVKILVSSLIGEVSLITLFVSFDKLFLIIFKVLLSVIMIFISFGREKFLENIFYFYVITIILGGTSYLLGGDGYLINVILLVLVSPIVITLYIKMMRENSEKLKVMHDVIIIDGEFTYKFNGYLDTGNKLIDPITKLPVLMVRQDLKLNTKRKFLVPYKVVNNSSLLECVKPDKVFIGGIQVNVLLGLCDKEIFKDDIEVILNDSLREMI